MNENRYDVVVIGSGVGGIASAALLARSGYRTLCVEKRPRLGGRFSTEEIEGFKLPTGAIFIHKSGEFARLLKELGILQKIDLRDLPDLVARLGGRDYDFSGKGRLRMMLEILSKTDSSTGEKGKIAAAAGREMMGQKLMTAFRNAVGGVDKKGAGLTVRDWLNQFTDNSQVHELFDSYCAGYAMAREWELPAGELFGIMAKTTGMTDVWMVGQGNITVINELAHMVRERGDVWEKTPVKRILIRKGKARGIVSEKGGNEEEIEARVVISDIGPRETVAIAGEEHFGEDYMRDCRVKLRPHPFVFIFVASDIPLCCKQGQKATYMITGARRIQGFTPLTNTCPDLAPPGQHLLYMCGEPISSLLPFDEEYEIGLCLEDIKEFLPDFERHGRILKIEPRNIGHDLPEGRTWQSGSYFMPRETPISNLFMVGDACLTPGLAGTSGSAEGAMRVVEAVKKKFKPA